MDKHFELNGPIKDINSYPAWAQDMVADTEAAKRDVVDHELFRLMRDGKLDPVTTRHFMVATWPVIERFPAYMARSLLKTRYGRSASDNLARRWLVRNIRVEQNHAEHWLAWAEGSGVRRSDVLEGAAPHGTEVLPDWCEEVVCEDSLAAGMAATNFAIEGVTGEWAYVVYDSAVYRESFDPNHRTRSLRWLELHAAYDDVHPWEALEIICSIIGNAPKGEEVGYLTECVKRSYISMRILGDRCMEAGYEAEKTGGAAEFVRRRGAETPRVAAMRPSREDSNPARASLKVRHADRIINKS